MKEKLPTHRYSIEFEDALTIKKRKPKETQQEGQQTSWYYLGFIGEIGFTIALPIAGGAFLGAFLDRRGDTYPRATLSFLFLGVIVSVVTFIRTVSDIMRRK